MEPLSPPLDPAADRLTRRARLAYLRQELSAPAMALAAYARDLAAAALATADDYAIAATDRIKNRADHFDDLVQKLVAADVAEPSADDDHWRKVRHDLRGALSYIVSACEDLSEGVPAEVTVALAADIARTGSTARKEIGTIEAVVRFGKSRDSIDTFESAAIRAMLAKLPSVHEFDLVIPGRVLVVDDNEYGRDLIARMISHQGHEVEAVASGREALDRLAIPGRPAIDLILLDVMMPEMTGPELLGCLKADPKLRHLPVIMVSALGEDDSVLACIAGGAEDYLTRPVKAELLKARIAGCLEKKRLRDREAEYQARIDGLVRAIFPPAVVFEWEQTGGIKPRLHDRVGVLFLDVVGFTAYCEKFQDDPGAVIRPLQELVEQFEETARRFGVQKIKTIGDAFLAVAGIPDPTPNPAATLLQCGLALIADAAAHPTGWKVRVGVHVGPVVTGVLGKTQFSFDVWGHTVNAASRVESNGRPGKVTLSADAWAMLDGMATGDERQVVARGIGLMTVWDFADWTGPCRTSAS